jgi:hypothetical protein
MQSNSSSLLRIAWLIGAASLTLSTKAAPETVGNLGDPQRFVFEGNAAVSTSQLREALRFDLDYVLAAQPSSPLPDLLDALPKLVAAGYQHAGFGDAQVAARYEDGRQRLVVKIQEGARYRCGAIQVTGAKELPVKLLVERLRQELTSTNGPSLKPGPDLLTEATRRDRDTRSPLEQLGLIPAGGITMITNASQVAVPAGTWHTNGFAAFDPSANLRYAEAVTNSFLALGWYGARFTTALAPNKQTRTADLVVTIEKEGSPVTIGEIDLTGPKKNSREAVLNYVDLKGGMQLTEDLERRVLKKLWDSGRFTHGHSHADTPDSRGRTVLHISVVEVELAPPLNQEFSENEKAALRLRDWLQNFSSREWDLGWEVDFKWAATGQGFSVRLLLSPSGVLLGQVEAVGASPNDRKLLFAGLAGGGKWGLYAPPHQIKAVGAAPEGELTMKCGLSAKGQLTNQANLFLGWSFSSGGQGERGPFSMDMDLEPAAFVEFARMGSLTDADRANTNLAAWALEKSGVRREGGAVQVTYEGGTIRFEEATGRLIELKGAEEDFTGLAGPVEYRVFTQRGAVAEATRRLAVATARHRDVSRGNAGSTLVAFFGEELLRSSELLRFLPQEYAPGKLAAASAALEKYAKALKLPDAWTSTEAASANPDALEFQIPPLALQQPSPTMNPLALAAAWFAAPGQNLVPEGSWLHRLFLAMTLQLAGHNERADAELKTVFEDEHTGPVACWIIAQSLARLGNPAARTFAIEGFVRRSAEDFRNDYRVLLRGDSSAARWTASFLKPLTVLDPTDVDALAAVLPEPDAAFLRRACAAMKQGGNKPLDEVLGPALDQWWKAAMKERIGALLRRFLTPPSAPAAGVRASAN